jgi:serine/threonine-protein kinase
MPPASFPRDERIQQQVALLFREVADLPPAERESVFAARNVPPELRAEVESLLACDATQDHAVTGCIGQAAEAAVRADGELRLEASIAGQTVGSYTLISPIGQGGMGTVWLAQRSDGRYEGRAAVKFLNAAWVGPAGGERFRREGSILARIAHPHIARLIDAGVSHFGQPILCWNTWKANTSTATAIGAPWEQKHGFACSWMCWTRSPTLT